MLYWTARQGFEGGAAGDLFNLRPCEKRSRPACDSKRFLKSPTKGLEGGTRIEGASNDRQPWKPWTGRGSRWHSVEPLTFLLRTPPLRSLNCCFYRQLGAHVQQGLALEALKECTRP
jgi:hypothetical protein